MDDTNLREKTLSSLFWNILERIGTQGVTFVVSIVLARLLAPAQYGILALTSAFMNIATVIVEVGFSTALIQKKDVNADDIASVFTVGFFVSLAMYAILFFTAPAIARFYEQPLLVLVIRVLGLELLLGSLKSVLSALLYREMLFKQFFYKNVFSIVISGTVGISLAYFGFGVWALVGQRIMSAVVLCLALITTVKWRPALCLRSKRLGSLLRFGGNVLANRVIGTVFDQLQALAIGKVYSAGTLAYYQKGTTFPALISTNTDFAVQKVMLPVYSRVQDERAAVKRIIRRSLKVSLFVLLPLLLGLASVADSVVRLLLTEKWLPCVPYMQVYCVYFIFQPVRNTFMQAINGIGRSDVNMKLTFISRIVGVIALAFTIRVGALAVAFAVLGVVIVFAFADAFLNRHFFHYTIREQLSDVLPTVLLTAVSCAAVAAVGYIPGLSTILRLTVQVACGAGVYFGLALVTKNENLSYLTLVVSQKLAGRRKTQ